MPYLGISGMNFCQIHLRYFRNPKFHEKLKKISVRIKKRYLGNFGQQFEKTKLSKINTLEFAKLQSYLQN